jgi:hypothetical protein
MKTYKLPNGQYTRSAKKYCREWRLLGEAVTYILPGYYVLGFDPGIGLGNDRGHCFTLPVVVANAIVDLLKRIK